MYDIVWEVEIVCSFAGPFFFQDDLEGVPAPPQCTTGPYNFHSNNLTQGAIVTVTKEDSMLDGTITIEGVVNSLSGPSAFDQFKLAVESYWNHAYSAQGLGVEIVINLTPNISGAVDLVITSGQTPPPAPGGGYKCGNFQPLAGGRGRLTIYNHFFCPEGVSYIAAHEMGHWIQFADAYDENDPTIILHCDPEDIMAGGAEVKWYHAQALWMRYEG